MSRKINKELKEHYRVCQERLVRLSYGWPAARFAASGTNKEDALSCPYVFRSARTLVGVSGLALTWWNGVMPAETAGAAVAAGEAASSSSVSCGCSGGGASVVPPSENRTRFCGVKLSAVGTTLSPSAVVGRRMEPTDERRRDLPPVFSADLAGVVAIGPPPPPSVVCAAAAAEAEAEAEAVAAVPPRASPDEPDGDDAVTVASYQYCGCAGVPSSCCAALLPPPPVLRRRRLVTNCVAGASS